MTLGMTRPSMILVEHLVALGAEEFLNCNRLSHDRPPWIKLLPAYTAGSQLLSSGVLLGLLIPLEAIPCLLPEWKEGSVSTVIISPLLQELLLCYAHTVLLVWIRLTAA